MLNIFSAFLLWSVVAIVASLKFTNEVKYSDVERSRLVKQGDRTATEEARRLEDNPLLVSLQLIVKTLLVSAFITYCVVIYGTFYGVLFGTVGILILPVAFRLPFVCKLADRLRDISMPWLQKATKTLHPVLSWLRERDTAGHEARLNSQAELLELIHRSPGVLTKDEQVRLEASLMFDERRVSDVMTPRSVIESVPVGETLGPLVLDELYKTGHSRFPVYERDLDHIVGMLYLHDLIDLKSGSQPAKKAMQSKVYFIREDRDLSHALHGFLTTRHHLFVVVNTYRETVGLLSLEDVIETLLGMKISDEFDAFDDLRAVAKHNPHDNNEPKGKKDI